MAIFRQPQHMHLSGAATRGILSVYYLRAEEEQGKGHNRVQKRNYR
jgi:hypothetical protein